MKKTLAYLGLLVAMLGNGQDARSATTIPGFSVTCATGTLLCGPSFSASVTTSAPWQAIQLKYDVAATHCSSVRLHIFVDGALVKTTGFMGWTGAPAPFNSLPLTTGVLSLQYVRSGVHVVSVNAEGQVSGCDAGKLVSWGGKLQLLP